MEAVETSAISLYLIDFDNDHYTENAHSTVEECLRALDHKGVTWIHVTSGDRKIIEAIGKAFNFHPLLLEDIGTSSERSKLQTYEDSVFFVLRLLEYSKSTQELSEQQVSMILGDNYLITFFKRESALLDPIRARARRPSSRIRQKGSAYLAYAILDAIVDNTFEIISAYDDKLEALEEEVILDPTPRSLLKIQNAKRELMLIRRTTWPLREIISQFRRVDNINMDKDIPFFLEDVHDHSIQAIETMEGFRDIVGGMLEIYISNISQRLNEIMKFLTIVATVFAPMTFLTGLYGMNFAHMPGADHPEGFLIALGFMALVTLIMLFFFYKKRWL